MIKLKTYIITVIAAIMIMVAIYFYMNSQTNAAIDNAKAKFDKEMKLAITKRDSVIQQRDSSITTLIETNERAKKESQHWYNEAVRASINPDYDFDFITSASIISNSHYKAGE